MTKGPAIIAGQSVLANDRFSTTPSMAYEYGQAVVSSLRGIISITQTVLTLESGVARPRRPYLSAS